MTALPDIPLPSGIRSRFVDGINGLRMHVLEAGFETKGRPCVLLLHGFPELAFSWRKVMPRLAAAGYHVIAPDQRGYGRTTGWDANYDGDLASFRLLNLVRDALGLVSAFGYRSVDAVVGHDFGSGVAAWCALVRPDVFRSVALMSAPFAGPPQLAFNTADAPPRPRPDDPVHRGRASTINGTTRRARPTPTCTARRKACMISCAPIIITRARTGKTTSLIRSKRGLRASWQSCRLTT
jgi:pimeloyl-ACP methyl ester carboxylesterase